MARFGFGGRLPTNLLPVEMLEADMNQMVDSTGETTPAMGGPERVAFQPGLQAQYAAKQQQPRAISPLEILDRVFDAGFTDALDAARARRDKQDNSGKFEALLQGLGLDPYEIAIAKTNPEAWSKEAAKRYGPTVAAAGSAIVTGGKTQYVPKTEVAGDSVLVSEGPDVRLAGRRPPSYQEQAVDAAKAAALLLQEKRLAGQLERWGAMNNQGASRVELSRQAGQRAAANAKKGGGTNSTLDAIAAELKRRGKL